MLRVAAPPSRASIEDFVRKTIIDMGVVEASQITDGSRLEDLGLDSLDVVELSLGVKKHLLIRVAPADFADVRTISDAVDLILHKAGIK